MAMLKWGLMIKKKIGDKLTQDEEDLLIAFKEPYDFTDRENIKAIINCIKA